MTIANNFYEKFKSLPTDWEDPQRRVDSLEKFIEACETAAVSKYNPTHGEGSCDRTVVFIFEDDSHLGISNPRQVVFRASASLFYDPVVQEELRKKMHAEWAESIRQMRLQYARKHKS